MQGKKQNKVEIFLYFTLEGKKVRQFIETVTQSSND